MIKYNFKPLGKTLLEIIVPTFSQAILFFVLAWLSMFVLFFGYFFRVLTGDPMSVFYLNEAASKYLQKVDEIPYGDFLSSAFVWAVVGAAVYGVTVTILNLVIIVDNKFQLTKDGLGPKLDFFSGLTEFRRLVWIFITGVYLSISWLIFMPKSVASFKEGLIASEPLKMFVSVLIISLIYYFAFMLIWVTLRNPILLTRK